MNKNFSGQILQGRSFRGENLQGADFSYTQLRSVDFQGADLTGANFNHVTTGLNWQWTIALLGLSLLLAGCGGWVASGIMTIAFRVWFRFSPPDLLLFVAFGGIVGLFYRFAIAQGIIKASDFLFKIGLWGIILAWATPFAGAGAGANALLVALVLGLFLISTFLTTVVVSISAALAMAVAGVYAVVFTQGIAILGAIPGVFMAAETFPKQFVPGGNVLLSLVVVLTGVEMAIAAYLGWQALSGQPKQRPIARQAVRLATWKGTNFQEVNLTQADFQNSRLKFADFRESHLLKTHWKGAKFTLIRSGRTYLRNPTIVGLITSKQGKNGNYQNLFLEGVNLTAAKLQGVNLTGAILNQADLTGADLSGAILKQTQLASADLTGVNLTGAYLENWGITATTQIDGIKGDYVYLRVPTPLNPNPHRKPDNYQTMFHPGELAEFIRPITNTLDLYHTQGVDPRAIAIAYRQLEESHPQAQLEIVALEKRGPHLLMRVKTSPVADRSQLNAEYFQTYQHFRAMAQANQSYFLSSSDRVQQIASMITTVLDDNN